jgi:hypothetical protein
VLDQEFVIAGYTAPQGSPLRLGAYPADAITKGDLVLATEDERVVWMGRA